MMKKRTSLKGKGNDIYFPDSTTLKNSAVTLPNNQTVEKATFYFPLEVIDGLDDCWIGLRKEFKRKKIRKSTIVVEAVKRFIRDLGGMPEEEKEKIF